MVRRLGRARSSAVEHLTFNQRVDGSIPSGLTNFAWQVLLRSSVTSLNNSSAHPVLRSCSCEPNYLRWDR